MAYEKWIGAAVFVGSCALAATGGASVALAHGGGHGARLARWDADADGNITRVVTRTIGTDDP